MAQINRRTALSLLTMATTALAVTARPAAAETHRTNHNIVIRNSAFVPAHITIKAGDTITWVNEDESVHSAWDLNDQFDTGLLQEGQSATLQFRTAGTYSYRSRSDAGMRATVTITR